MSCYRVCRVGERSLSFNQDRLGWDSETTCDSRRPIHRGSLWRFRCHRSNLPIHHGSPWRCRYHHSSLPIHHGNPWRCRYRHSMRPFRPAHHRRHRCRHRSNHNLRGNYCSRRRCYRPHGKSRHWRKVSCTPWRSRSGSMDSRNRQQGMSNRRRRSIPDRPNHSLASCNKWDIQLHCRRLESVRRHPVVRRK